MSKRFSSSPNGPSSHRLSFIKLQNPMYFETNDLSTVGLEKAFKSLRFSDLSRVITIPSRHECLQPDMDLWWSNLDYMGFKQMRSQESQSGMDLASFNFQKTQANDELVDLRILFVSNECLLSSSLTQNLASALGVYEKELNQHRAEELELTQRTEIPYKRVRSSVTRASHYSKEYALAVEGPAHDLPYNVVIFDSGRTMTAKDELERAKHGIGEEEREHKQATSYAEDTHNSYIVNAGQSNTTTGTMNISPLLLSGSFDVSEVPFEENFLLKKIIKCGVALCYICQDPLNSSGISSIESCSPSQLAGIYELPMAIPSSEHDLDAAMENTTTFFPPVRRKSVPILISSRPTYSLLKDHADVLIDPTQSLTNSPSFVPLDGLEALLPENPRRSSKTTVEGQVNTPSSGINHASNPRRILSVDDWLCLFRVTAQRNSKACAPVQEQSNSMNINLALGTRSPPCSPRNQRSSNSESLLSKMFRGNSNIGEK